MKKILITGANSYIGTSFEKYISQWPEEYQVDTIDMIDGSWREKSFAKYDVVYHVAGIAHSDSGKISAEKEKLYRSVNTDLTIETAKKAKADGVRQFIFMSSQIVYKESRSLKANIITPQTKPEPNGFYGDSKLQAELRLHQLEDASFKVVILRPPMIYGPKCKGNFLRLAKLATKTPIFPAFHNKRSMLFIDNLCEFVKQTIIREISGTYYPQNAELADTVEIVKFFAKKNNHKIHIWKWLNIFVYLGSPFVKALNKMFADSFYVLEMSKYDFEYQIVNLKDSFNNIDLEGASLTHMN